MYFIQRQVFSPFLPLPFLLSCCLSLSRSLSLSVSIQHSSVQYLRERTDIPECSRLRNIPVSLTHSCAFRKKETPPIKRPSHISISNSSSFLNVNPTHSFHHNYFNHLVIYQPPWPKVTSSSSDAGYQWAGRQGRLGHLTQSCPAGLQTTVKLPPATTLS